MGDPIPFVFPSPPPSPPPGGGGGGAGGQPIDLTSVVLLLQAILTEFVHQYGPAQVNGYVDFNPNGTVGTTAAALYPTNKKVRRAIIQNLSTTDNYTITSSGQPGKIATTTAKGTGPILNKASGTGLGGGTITVGNIDLSELTIVSDTNTGQNVAVYYEV